MLEQIALNNCAHHERTKTKFSSAVKIVLYVVEYTTLFSDRSLYKERHRGISAVTSKTTALELVSSNCLILTPLLAPQFSTLKCRKFAYD